MELLHKSFEEFVEEFKSLYDTDYSHRTVREVFQEHERQRLSKLIYNSTVYIRGRMVKPVNSLTLKSAKTHN